MRAMRDANIAPRSAMFSGKVDSEELSGLANCLCSHNGAVDNPADDAGRSGLAQKQPQDSFEGRKQVLSTGRNGLEDTLSRFGAYIGDQFGFHFAFQGIAAGSALGKAVL